MRLCIDRGNSSTKIGVFKQDELVYTYSYPDFGIKEFYNLINQYSISSCIFSTVSERDNSVIDEINNQVDFFIEFDHLTPIPVKNEYQSPETLGKDRLAAVIGASYLKPNTDILVIDAGSAITFDFIDKNNIYKGGNISPGMNLRFRSLHEFTSKLPLVEAEGENPLLGVDTFTAIRSGVIQGIVYEMDGYIDELKAEYHELSSFLTGGNTFYFANKLKNAIFANTNLVLIGLNRILQYNV